MENQSVNFGSANSNYGQCIILSGGPGSGKGKIKERILANYKNVDVDELKEMYMKMVEQGKIKDRHYDIGDENDVSTLHSKVKEKGWKKKRNDAFWRGRVGVSNYKNTSNSKLLPNILFDMVGGDISDFTKILQFAKPMGYKVTVVWVLANIETAREGNRNRSRHVSDAVIVNGHLESRAVLPKLLKGDYPEVNDIDNAWIGLGAGFGRKLGKEYEDSPIIKLRKNNDGSFNFKNFEDVVNKFLNEQ